MASLELIPVEFDESRILPEITPIISNLSGFEVSVQKRRASIIEFYNSERAQYDGGRIIEKFELDIEKDKAIIFTSVDLFIPIFTFVFGLAKLNGKAGIVSSHRLNPEFYGLPRDESMLTNRIIKETIHELGHLLNLRHCSNYQCVMFSSNSADDLDVKGAEYCTVCKSIVSNKVTKSPV